MDINSNNRTLILVVIVLFVIGILFISKNATTGEAVRQKPECNDKIDNDGDGYCDFLTRKTVCINKSVIPGDVDCANKEDNNESPDCEPIPERCDGYDNDCDSLVDEDLPIVCNSTVDCGIPRWTSDYYCGHDGNVYRDSISYQCNFPGTCSSSCSSQTTSQLIEQCSARCLNGQCISGNTTSGNTTS